MADSKIEQLDRRVLRAELHERAACGAQNVGPFVIRARVGSGASDKRPAYASSRRYAVRIGHEGIGQCGQACRGHIQKRGPAQQRHQQRVRRMEIGLRTPAYVWVVAGTETRALQRQLQLPQAWRIAAGMSALLQLAATLTTCAVHTTVLSHTWHLTTATKQSDATHQRQVTRPFCKQEKPRARAHIAVK